MKKEWAQVNLKVDFISESKSDTPSALARSTFFYILGSRHMVLRQQFYTRRKNLNGYLIFYTLEGTGFLSYGNKNYTLSKNSVMLIDCMDYHEYYPLSCDHWEVKFIHFSGGMSKEYFNLINKKYGPVIAMNEKNNISRLIDNIINNNIDINLEVNNSLYILEILTEILRVPIKDKFSPVGSAENTIHTALEYIHQNSHMDISLKQLSDITYMSVFHFSRLFKKTTGFSPHEYILKRRLSNAKQLLLYSELAISEIAYTTGFKSLNTFTKAFKKMEAVTPSEYRSSSII